MPQTQKGRKQNTLKVIPLGGVEEIGKNITVLEYGNDMIVVDCGLAFPTEEMPGIDMVIPDFTYIEENQHKLRGMLITHGHEDHIGAVPFFLKKINVPVYGTKLTLMLIEDKLAENGVKSSTLNCVQARDTVKLGCFSVEFFATNHSIADSVGLAITTPVGVVVMTGDFKVDFTPVDGEMMDFSLLARYGEREVLALIADSTNAERPGYTISEKTVGRNLEGLVRKAKGRIIISTFSSNIHRIQQIIDIAASCGRKVCFAGRSMIRIARMAQDIGLMKIKTNGQIAVEKVSSLKDNQVVIITTGSQGEPMSGLVRMAGGEHAHIEIKEGDTVIFSARPIPGNEKSVNRIVNQLYRLGAVVVSDAWADVHTSGHACVEELKLIHALVKPRFFVPVHGEYRHLKQHALLAESLGMKPDHILIPENGQTIEFTRRTISLGQTVASGAVMVDGFSEGNASNDVLRERRVLSEDGIVVIVLPLKKNKTTLAGTPEVTSRGFIYENDARDLLDETQKVVETTISHYRPNRNTDRSVIKGDVRRDVSKFLYSKTHRNPMILTVVIEV